jgi:hypothetical protein
MVDKSFVRIELNRELLLKFRVLLSLFKLRTAKFNRDQGVAALRPYKSLMLS